jgi:hypothetical protein
VSNSLGHAAEADRKAIADRTVAASAHQLLADLIRRDALVPTESIARHTPSGMRVSIAVEHETLLTPAQRTIVDLLTPDVPRKLSWLWERAGNPEPGKEISGSFKSLCTSLCKLGIAKHIPRQGYVLVGRPPPPDSE